MRPKILSPNVLSTVGEIGNVINKTIVVPNIITIKGTFQVHPWVFIIYTHQECQIPCSGIYEQVLLLHDYTVLLPSIVRSSVFLTLF